MDEQEHFVAPTLERRKISQ